MGELKCSQECITRRALQRFFIFMWMVFFLFAHMISVILFYYLIFHTRFWIFPIIYLFWLYTDWGTAENGGRGSEAVRNFFAWKYIIDYFPVSLETTCPITPDRNYIFIGHPHGILSVGNVMTYANNLSDFKKKIPGFDIRVATLKLNFMFPIHREIFLGMGGVAASWKSLIHVLTKNKKPTILGIVPGGSAEAFYSRPNTNRLHLKNKYGFIKLALMTGTSLVPTYTFGEVDIFDQMNNDPGTKLHKIQQFLYQLTGVAFCVFYGRGLYKNYLKIIPYKVPMTVVVGEPIDIPKIENPSREEIQQYHNIYVEKLKNIFYTNRDKYVKDSSNVDLIID